MFQTKGAGYMHPKCAPAWLVGEYAGEMTAALLVEGIEANSIALDATALDEIKTKIAAAPLPADAAPT